MSEITDLHVDHLVAGMRRWASGHQAEAAVELLVGHRGWLHRPDFVTTALRVLPDGLGADGSEDHLVAVDWERAARYAGRIRTDGPDVAVLRVALGLAGQPVAPPLGELIGRLDQAGTTLVLHAIAHAAGWHERGTVALVTGGFRVLSPV
jgi:hypothetical protein